MGITQSVEAPLTNRDSVFLSGNLGNQNGVGSGSISTTYRRLTSDRGWTEVNHVQYGWEIMGLIGRKINMGGYFHINMGGYFHTYMYCLSIREGVHVFAICSKCYNMYMCSRVPLMWTPKGRAKSVHISEPSTVVDTLCCGHIIVSQAMRPN